MMVRTGPLGTLGKRISRSLNFLVGFPLWFRGKESSCNTGATKDIGSIPGLGRSPGGGHDNPLQYSRLENPTDRGAGGGGGIVHRVAGSDTTEVTQHAHSPLGELGGRLLVRVPETQSCFKAPILLLQNIRLIPQSWSASVALGILAFSVQ